jgi:hypothetical protein
MMKFYEWTPFLRLYWINAADNIYLLHCKDVVNELFQNTLVEIIDVYEGGCTAPFACNYNPTATVDDGSCLDYDECGVCGGEGMAEGDCDCEGNQLDALEICGGDCISDFNGNSVCDPNEIFGCTYSSAINYNPEATADDGSCEYSFSDCPADIDGDGIVTTQDLLSFLSFFGETCL